MRLRYLGHSAFLVDLAGGRQILFDPYEPGGLGGTLRYRPLPISPELVLISHEHPDHACTSWLSGSPRVLRDAWQDDELEISLRLAHHDEYGGRLRGGQVRMFSLRAEGLHLLHCGDLGERLMPIVTNALAPVDVLMVPVGGYYTLGPEAATELVRQVEPRMVLPCHYRSRHLDREELAPLSAFLRRFESSRGPGKVIEADQIDPHRSVESPPLVVAMRALGGTRDDTPN